MSIGPEGIESEEMDLAFNFLDALDEAIASFITDVVEGEY